jgi:hypothetical protein
LSEQDEIILEPEPAPVTRGKYDDKTEALRSSLGAHCVLVVVMGTSPENTGMSVALSNEARAAHMEFGLPEIIRGLADEIAKQNRTRLMS